MRPPEKTQEGQGEQHDIEPAQHVRLRAVGRRPSRSVQGEHDAQPGAAEDRRDTQHQAEQVADDPQAAAPVGVQELDMDGEGAQQSADGLGGDPELDDGCPPEEEQGGFRSSDGISNSVIGAMPSSAGAIPSSAGSLMRT
jgi:hypothetical protein